MSDLRFEATTDSAQVERIYRAIRPESDPRRFHWLCALNPAGPALHYLARSTEGGEAIGCVTVIPMCLRIDGQAVALGQLVDGMVLAAYRRGGVFGRLLDFAMAEARQRLDGIIGFPNELSLGPCLRAGYRVIGEFSTFVLPLRGEFVARRFVGARRGWIPRAIAAGISPFLNVYLALRVGSGRAPAQPLSREAIASANELDPPPRPVFTPRDREFAIWRYFDVPSDDYEVVDVGGGRAVVRAAEGDAEIIDLALDAEPVREREQLRALVALCRRRGFESVQMQCSPSNPFCPGLHRLGFVERRGVSSVILLPFAPSLERLRFGDYFLTRADSDWI